MDLSVTPFKSGPQLLEIPSHIFETDALEVLDLSGNAIERIPPEIGKLHRLKSLSVAANRLTSLPPELFELKSLERLDITGNALRFVPQGIMSLPNLRQLSFGADDMVIAPEWLKECKGLRELAILGNGVLGPWIGQMETLSVLRLRGNLLSALPSWLTQLQKLKILHLDANLFVEFPAALIEMSELRSLSLWVNQIDKLPLNIGEMTSLISLNLSGNRLSTLPNSFQNLHKLRILDLSNNLFSTLPRCLYSMPSLRELMFRNADAWGWSDGLRGGRFTERNDIKEISSEILSLANLEKCEFDAQTFETPPPEVVGKGVRAIFDFFRQLEAQGTDHLYEAKLLIVGEGGAGKTTLAQKIEDPTYELTEEKSTEGIDVIHWRFPLDNGREFKVNIWDFGGQEIYHATHQFFLTKRSLYILVADTRKEDTDFYYWLNILELLTDESPVLVVKNEKQDRHREISERQLRGQFPALKETLSANLATNRGLHDIVKSVKYHIANLQHVGTPLPATWVKVREALERNPSNYLPLGEYLAVCEKHGFIDVKDKLHLADICMT